MSLSEVLLKLHDDPVYFTEEILRNPDSPDGRVHLEEWQREFLITVAANPRTACKSANGVGKTMCLAVLILWWLLTRHPCKIAVTAPGQPQIDSCLWPELRMWHSRLPEEFQEQIEIVRDQARLIAAPERAFCVARTSSREKPEALKGMHSPNMLYLIDEARGVDQAVFDAAVSSLSAPSAKIAMCRNPTRITGYFADAFNKNADMWKLMTVRAMDRKHSRNGVLIETIVRTYGIEHDQYKICVLGQFPLREEWQLIPRHLVESAVGRDIVPPRQTPTIWGVDIARSADGDRSALAKRKGTVLLEPVRSWRGKDTMQSAAIIQDEFQQTPYEMRPQEIFLDRIGLGWGVYDRCRRLGLPVRAVNVAETPAWKERFQLLRDELWWRAREFFQSRDCSLPKGCDELIAELCFPTYEHNENRGGKIKVESKDSMKKRGFKGSPDLADAFILSLTNDTVWRNSADWAEIEIDTSWVT